MAKHCFFCDRELQVVDDVPRYVTSNWTKNHYCMPGEGCWVTEDPFKITEESAASAESSPGLEISKSGNNNPRNLSAESTGATSVPAPAT